MTDQSEHIRNTSEFKSGCYAYGQHGYLEAKYAGRVFIRGLEDGYAGGENKNKGIFKSFDGGFFLWPGEDKSVRGRKGCPARLGCRLGDDSEGRCIKREGDDK